MTRFEQLKARLIEANSEALLVERFGMEPVALYDRRRCIEILMMRDGMNEEAAEEFFGFNIIGSWMGEGTPAFAVLSRESR